MSACQLGVSWYNESTIKWLNTWNTVPILNTMAVKKWCLKNKGGHHNTQEKKYVLRMVYYLVRKHIFIGKPAKLTDAADSLYPTRLTAAATDCNAFKFTVCYWAFYTCTGIVCWNMLINFFSIVRSWVNFIHNNVLCYRLLTPTSWISHNAQCGLFTFRPESAQQM